MQENRSYSLLHTCLRSPINKTVHISERTADTRSSILHARKNCPCACERAISLNGIDGITRCPAVPASVPVPPRCTGSRTGKTCTRPILVASRNPRRFEHMPMPSVEARVPPGLRSVSCHAGSYRLVTDYEGGFLPQLENLKGSDTLKLETGSTGNPDPGIPLQRPVMYIVRGFT